MNNLWLQPIVTDDTPKYLKYKLFIRSARKIESEDPRASSQKYTEVILGDLWGNYSPTLIFRSIICKKYSLPILLPTQSLPIYILLKFYYVKNLENPNTVPNF